MPSDVLEDRLQQAAAFQAMQKGVESAGSDTIPVTCQLLHHCEPKDGFVRRWYKLPVWLQKNYGKWLLDGGGGYQVVPQTNYRDFPYRGWLVKRELNERLELGAELFAHGREGFAAPQTQRSTMIDIGGYYHFKHNPSEQFLFCYGHSIAGQTENYAYAGMYWTWGEKDSQGKDDKKDMARSNWMQGPMRGNGFE